MSPDRSGGQLPFDYGHEPSHLEDDFIEGDGNRLALAHIRAFPRWPHPLTLLEGPPKAGKSHLGRIWQERAGAMPATPQSAEVLAHAAGRQPLLVEDVDRAGYAEAALFHLLNQSMRDRRPVLMTARTAVSSWPYRTDDVRSRARLAAAFTLSLTDDIQLSQIFVKLFGDRQVAVDPRIIRHLVARMERSPEEASVLAERLDKLALARGGPITRALANEVLAMRRAERGEEPEEGAWEGEDEDE